MFSRLFVAMALSALSLHASATTFAYVASSADGTISQYRLDSGSGQLTLVNKTVAGEQASPMAISPDHNTLFVALRSKPYKSVSYRIEPRTGALTRLSDAPLPDSMAYLSTDKSGHFLMGASYGGDVISVQRINPDSSVQAQPTQVLKTGLHAHSVRTDNSNRFLYAGNLGVDHVLQYTFDTNSGTLDPIGAGFVNAPANSGPRHLAFSPNGKFLFVVGETDGSVTAYAINASTGALTQAGHLSGIPARLNLAPGIVRDARNNDGKDDPTPRIWAADIKISPDGKLLYISERTTSSVSAFAVNPSTGALRLLNNYPVQEKQPRNIAISADGKWLLVSGEKSAVVGSYAINAKDGSLKRAGEAPAGQNALWIELLER